MGNRAHETNIRPKFTPQKIQLFVINAEACFVCNTMCQYNTTVWPQQTKARFLHRRLTTAELRPSQTGLRHPSDVNMTALP